MSRLVEPEDAQPCPQCGELRSIITADAGSPATTDEPDQVGTPRYGCVNEKCPAYDPGAGTSEGRDPEEAEVKANRPTGADDVGA